MNVKAIYAAGGGIAAVAIIIFLVINTGVFTNTNSSGQGINQNAFKNPVPIEISIKNVSAKQIDNKRANIQVIFNAHNPNMGTLILEAIDYNLFVDGAHIASGSIGTKPEGLVASQAGIYPIIGNGTVTLKDIQPTQLSSMVADKWEKMLGSKATYLINGTYSYTQTSSLQATGADKEFKLTFP